MPDGLSTAITQWIDQEPEKEHALQLAILLKSLANKDENAQSVASDLFNSRLSFGTAGIRGPLRPGPNGMNRIVVSQTTAGLSRYLLSRLMVGTTSPLLVVVGFDGRHSSAIFARDTAEVLSGCGIRAVVLPCLLPTPLLAFAVCELKADAGVMVTASHNPANDNGYKLYLGGPDRGSQIVPPIDRDIEAHVQDVASSQSWSDIPRSTESISIVDGAIVDAYIVQTIESLGLSNPKKRLSVVYTAMHGVGGETFLTAMDAAGFPKPHVVEEQFNPNPDFPTVAFPNPEEKGALDLSFEKAHSVGADLVIAHDPDADRLAVALPDSSSSGEYRALTGNQVGAIFGWHIAEKAGSSGKTGTLANSLVSSPVLGRIADHFGLSHEETLTGFKYVSRVKNLIFGFEEALGYLVTPDVVRDKDGISAGLLMVSLAHTLAGEGRTLWDYLHEIEESVGAFASGQVTIRLDPGAAGSTITNALREQDLSALGCRSVNRRDDFLEGVGNFPKEDILRYFLDDGTRVIARPSGTEPKVKIYIDTEGTTSAEAQSRLTEVESDINKLVSSL